MNEQPPPKPPENAGIEKESEQPITEEQIQAFRQAKDRLDKAIEARRHPPEGENMNFPSKEEVRSVFGRFVKGREYKEVKFQADENGVSVYEIETTDERGDLVVYNFGRAKYNYRDPSLPKEAQYSASIHSTLYDGDMPVGGECVANYLDGKWEYPE